MYLWMENHKKGKNHDFIVQIFSKSKNSWLLVFSLPTTTRDSLLRSFSDLKGQTELHYVGWAKNQNKLNWFRCHYPLITYLKHKDMYEILSLLYSALKSPLILKDWKFKKYVCLVKIQAYQNKKYGSELIFPHCI